MTRQSRIHDNIFTSPKNAVVDRCVCTGYAHVQFSPCLHICVYIYIYIYIYIYRERERYLINTCVHITIHKYTSVTHNDKKMCPKYG